MKFTLEKPEISLISLARALGYQPQLSQQGFTAIRLLGRNKYPRFHLFIKEQENNLVLDLHLDQKAPSYTGTRSHSGEHQGAVIEEEANRIKAIVNNLP